MTDATGRKVDFSNTVIVMTSNVGARRIGRHATVGFQRDDAASEYRDMRNRVMDEVKKVFNPEFLNRVDELVVFHRLTETQLLDIVDIHVAEVLQRGREMGIMFNLTPEAKQFLVKKGSDEQYGARPLRRAVQLYVEDPLSELMLRGEFQPGTELEIQVHDEEDRLEFTPRAAAAEGVTT